MGLFLFWPFLGHAQVTCATVFREDNSELNNRVVQLSDWREANSSVNETPRRVGPPAEPLSGGLSRIFQYPEAPNSSIRSWLKLVENISIKFSGQLSDSSSESDATLLYQHGANDLLLQLSEPLIALKTGFSHRPENAKLMEQLRDGIEKLKVTLNSPEVRLRLQSAGIFLSDPDHVLQPKKYAMPEHWNQDQALGLSSAFASHAKWLQEMSVFDDQKAKWRVTVGFVIEDEVRLKHMYGILRDLGTAHAVFKKFREENDLRYTDNFLPLDLANTIRREITHTDAFYQQLEVLRRGLFSFERKMAKAMQEEADSIDAEVALLKNHGFYSVNKTAAWSALTLALESSLNVNHFQNTYDLRLSLESIVDFLEARPSLKLDSSQLLAFKLLLTRVKDRIEVIQPKATRSVLENIKRIQAQLRKIDYQLLRQTP